MPREMEVEWTEPQSLKGQLVWPSQQPNNETVSDKVDGEAQHLALGRWRQADTWASRASQASLPDKVQATERLSQKVDSVTEEWHLRLSTGLYIYAPTHASKTRINTYTDTNTRKPWSWDVSPLKENQTAKMKKINSIEHKLCISIIKSDLMVIHEVFNMDNSKEIQKVLGNKGTLILLYVINFLLGKKDL